MKAKELCANIFSINGTFDKCKSLFTSAKNDITIAYSTIDKCETLLTAAKDDILTEKTKNFEHNVISSIYLLENVLMKLRALANTPYTISSPTQYESMLNNVATNIYHIAMDQKDNVTHITLPCLLPHYKENHKNIVTAPLNAFLKKYIKENGPLPVYKKIVFVVINHVDENKPASRIRDNDNYEYKQLINTLAGWFLPDDNQDYCSMFNTTVKGSSDSTEVYLVPYENFQVWCKENFTF